MSFNEQLSVQLKFTVGTGTAIEVTGDSLVSMTLDLHEYGFSGELVVRQLDSSSGSGKEKDKLLTDFLKTDALKVEVTLVEDYPSSESPDDLPTIAVVGHATARSLTESFPTSSTDASIVREYSIKFTDTASFVWSRHFPCELYTEKSLKDILAAHKCGIVSLNVESTKHSDALPQAYVGLPENLGRSFYDFLVWRVQDSGDMLLHDYEEHELKIASKLPAADPSKPRPEYFGSWEIDYPPSPHHQIKLHNSYVNGAKTLDVDSPKPITGLRRDHLYAKPVASDMDTIKTGYTSAHVEPNPVLKVVATRWPSTPIVPGETVELSAANKWPSSSQLLKNKWRFANTLIRLTSTTAHDHLHARDRNSFFVEIEMELDSADRTSARLPPYATPSYPQRIEGTIVSEIAEDKDTSYAFAEDEESSIPYYDIKVPLWSDQIIKAPMFPHLASGKLYFPDYRDQRVLVALDYTTAQVDQLLEWSEWTPLPQDDQAEHVFFGRSDENCTSVRHKYESDKPSFSIKRTNDKDFASFVMEEGALTIVVAESE